MSSSSHEYQLDVVGNLLFADSQVYDISNVTPVLIHDSTFASRDRLGSRGEQRFGDRWTLC